MKNITDNTSCVITARNHIECCHRTPCTKLPETAILFFMHSGVDYANEHYDTELITDKFPSFLNSRPLYKIKNENVCFIHGGWGAPMAADTIETLKELGVKNVISVGMFGAFSNEINVGDIVIPNKAFVEEGTSPHYYGDIEFSSPNTELQRRALDFSTESADLPIVSTDAVYRQTFYRENLWRSRGAVGVDMETSALFSVGRYVGANVVSILIASDKHPLNEKDEKWQWKMTRQMRYDFFEKCINFALSL